MRPPAGAGPSGDKCRAWPLSLYFRSSFPASPASCPVGEERAGPWPFALRRQRLVLSAEAAQGPWPFAFALPSDSVRVVGAARPDPITARPGPDVCFEIVGDRLETDADGVLLTYVSGLVTTFPELFADMLAWRAWPRDGNHIFPGAQRKAIAMFEQALTGPGGGDEEGSSKISESPRRRPVRCQSATPSISASAAQASGTPRSTMTGAGPS